METCLSLLVAHSILYSALAMRVVVMAVVNILQQITTSKLWGTTSKSKRKKEKKE